MKVTNCFQYIYATSTVFTFLQIFALGEVSFPVLGLENLLFRGQKLEENYFSEGKNQKKSKKEAQDRLGIGKTPETAKK